MATAEGKLQPLTGEVVYLYAFDVAHEMRRDPVRQLLGQPVAQFVVDASKRNPRQLFFFRPQMVRLTPLERMGPHGPVRVERILKLLPVGAISITVRVPFRVDRLADLIEYHDLRFGTDSLHDEVRALAEEARRELAGHFIRPVEALRDEEAYTVFCIATSADPAAPDHMRTQAWLDANRRTVASVLTQESDPDHLSEQEVEESIVRRLSYYDHDLVVMDWDAAIVIDDPRLFDETVYIMELANLQLTELEAYDRILDEAVERAYRDLGPRLIAGPRQVRDLRELRIDLARLSDELSNITKFFGDWHTARVYQAIAERFHLADWHRSIDEKLKTLDEMYQLLMHERNNRLMLILEATIILLFVLDLAMLAVPFFRH